MSSRHSAHPQSQDQCYRMALNQYLQYWRRQDDLYWSEAQSGRLERPSWTVVCYLSNVPYGCGHGSTKGMAKERAAQQTLEILNRQQQQQQQHDAAAATAAAAWSVGCSRWTTSDQTSYQGYPSHDYHTYTNYLGHQSPR